jgi:hypothetical protein
VPSLVCEGLFAEAAPRLSRDGGLLTVTTALVEFQQVQCGGLSVTFCSKVRHNEGNGILKQNSSAPGSPLVEVSAIARSSSQIRCLPRCLPDQPIFHHMDDSNGGQFTKMPQLTGHGSRKGQGGSPEHHLSLSGRSSAEPMGRPPTSAPKLDFFAKLRL